MNHVRLAAVPEEESRSPTGKFHSFSRNVSLALGGIRNGGTWAGGHPFDLQLRRVPAGATICPYHAHFAQWEFFYVQTGTGSVRTPDGTFPLRPGDCFVHPPGTAHQLHNNSTDDLEILIITDNPPLDGCYYPDSNKYALRPPGIFFRVDQTHYLEGEDTLPPDTKPNRMMPAPPSAVLTPFASRKCHIDDLAWTSRHSPKGKFRGTSKELSLALGAKHDTPTGLGGHPFDVELGKLAPGETPCPFHSHAAQWELFLFLSGTAKVRAGDETQLLSAGDAVLHPPGEAHAFSNVGDTDLLYLCIADNPPVDYSHYPDSNKWGLHSPHLFFHAQPVDYFDGEE